ncbi:MAG: ral nucleoside transport system permease protein [Thermotogota bacterium]|nr:ral nucleoside transport system permease protein [Thermotogota bacterium]MDK2864814.1 ral nucleoside transport system permease protein [Thermotogota bacterium]
MLDGFISVATAAVRSGTPLLYATLGEILTERSGVLNIGLEGIMLMGAITGFAVVYSTGNLLLAVLMAMVMGAIFGALHAFFSVTLRVNQVVTGLAIAMLGKGLSGFWGKSYIGVVAPRFEKLPIPVLKDIPFLGPVFFNHDILVYITYLLVPFLWFFIYRTSAGLTLRAVGEAPEAADAKGINVFAHRYFYTIIGGALTALGGAYLSLAYASMWIENMTAERGWIAVALVVLSTWDPVKAILFSYLFGGIDALQFYLQVSGTTVSAHILKMLPYLATVIAVVFTSREKVRKLINAPTALGIPFSREEEVA